MSRARVLEHQKLAAEAAIRGAAVVARQREIIAELERKGRDTTDANALLMTLMETQVLHERHLDYLNQELSELAV